MLACLCAENIYDEPSLPDPIYQEVDSKSNMTVEQEMQIEMMKNYSYACVKSKKCQFTIILNECPAYIQQS